MLFILWQNIKSSYDPWQDRYSKADKHMIKGVPQIFVKAILKEFSSGSAGSYKKMWNGSTRACWVCYCVHDNRPKVTGVLNAKRKSAVQRWCGICFLILENSGRELNWWLRELNEFLSFCSQSHGNKIIPLSQQFYTELCVNLTGQSLWTEI